MHKKKSLFFKLLIITTPLILLLVPVLIPYVYGELTIFPNNKSMNSYTYTDEYFGGNSEVNEFITNENKLILSYTLGENYKLPHVGFDIVSANKTGYFDLSKYNCLRIKVKSELSRNMFLFIIIWDNNFSSAGDDSSHPLMEKDIPLEKTEKVHNIPFSDFMIPNWWYKMCKITEADISKPDFSKVRAFSTATGSTLPLDTQDTIEISEITFYRTNTAEFIITIIVILLYYIVLTTIFIYKKHINILREKVKKIVIPYKYLEMGNFADKEIKKIISYLAENYTKQDLSIKKVSNQSMVPMNRIPLVIKQTFNLSFPEYLNSIRLAQAKEILTGTNDTVTDIALSVGYNSISHFNRVFKRYNKVSPVQYRKTSQFDVQNIKLNN